MAALQGNLGRRADHWRNSDQDLPQDFDTRRSHYYSELGKPLDSTGFLEPLLPWLSISPRGGGRITLSPLEPDPEPRNLRRLKDELRTRWGLVPLLDMLTEIALRVGLVEHFAPAGSRGAGRPRARGG